MVSVRDLAENSAGTDQKLEKFNHWFVKKNICEELVSLSKSGWSQTEELASVFNSLRPSDANMRQ